jgi:hypothetical protein
VSLLILFAAILSYIPVADFFCAHEGVGLPRTPLLLNFPCDARASQKAAYVAARLPAVFWDFNVAAGALHLWSALELWLMAARLVLCLCLPGRAFKVGEVDNLPYRVPL